MSEHTHPERFGATTFTTPNERDLVATRRFTAPRGLLWQMWTEPKHITQWMVGPDGWSMPVCEVDVRPGGRWHWEWQKGDGGERMAMDGEYGEIDAPLRLVTIERWGGDWPATQNTLVLKETASETVIEQTVRYPSTEARERAIQTGLKDSTAKAYDKLEQYLRKVM